MGGSAVRQCVIIGLFILLVCSGCKSSNISKTSAEVLPTVQNVHILQDSGIKEGGVSTDKDLILTVISDRDVQLVSKELGVSANILANVPMNLSIKKHQPGRYFLDCSGCDGRSQYLVIFADPTNPSNTPQRPLYRAPVTITQNEGIQPSVIKSRIGVALTISSDIQTHLINRQLRIDQTIQAGQKAIVTIDQPPGTYVLICKEGCNEKSNVITVTIDPTAII